MPYYNGGYGSFGVRGYVTPGQHYHVTGGPRYRRRRSRRRYPSEQAPRQVARVNQPVSTPANPQPAFAESARAILANPAVRRALGGAIAGAISGGLPGALTGGAAGMLGGGNQLALPPPMEE